MQGGTLHVGLLGPFEVRLNGRAAGPAGARRRGVLALLALEANGVVPIDALIDRLWGDEPPVSAVNVVQTYVSAWRKSLGEIDGRSCLVTVGAGYRLEVTPEQCDLLQFRHLAHQARRARLGGGSAESARLLAQALSLWRGPALVDLSREPFHSRVSIELEAERLQVLESWAEATLLTGGDASTVAELVAAARGREPLRERLTELLMWALTACGRQAEAAEVFAATRQCLRDELGADPGPALTAMHARVLRADPDLQVPTRTMSSRASLPTRPANTAVDRLIGRVDELAAVTTLLEAQRLVTLTGPGGSGKTRLAREVLARRDKDLPAWFVELDSLRDSALAPATIAAALNVQTAAGTDALESLAAQLADTSGLLVLDNLEHLANVHQVVDRLHRGTHHLRILVTSREPLRVEGEQQFLVPLLPVPAHDGDDLEVLLANDSVRLLTERVRAHHPGFQVDAADAGHIVDIVRRLDGLPLALEIVAPWLRLMTPAALASRLTAPLDMPGRRADTAPRHRTLRDTIDWSDALLRPRERDLLRRLSIFAGSFSVEAVEQVCAPATGPATVVEDLFNLIDHNLVQIVEPLTDHARCRLLGTIRDYAAEQAVVELGAEVQDLRRRHTRWYAQWATRLARNSEGPTSGTWLASAIAEADNLRAAIDACADSGETGAWLQLVVDAMTLWFEAGHEQEGEQRLAAALRAAGPADPARAIGLTYWAWLRATLNRAEAAAAAQEAVALARAASDPAVEAFALQTVGDTLDDPEDCEKASRAVFDAADRAETVVIRYGPTAPDAVRCGASYSLAAAWLYRSVPTALSWQQEALRRAELEGDRRIIGVNAARLALVELLAGDTANAEQQVARSLALVSDRVTARWEDIVTYAQAQVNHHTGHVDEAELRYLRLLRSTASSGRPLHAILSAVAVADLYTADDRLDEAVAVLAQAEEIVGRSADDAHLVPLQVRRARIDRCSGRLDIARQRLAQVAKSSLVNGLPPQRVVWLNESARLAVDTADFVTAQSFLGELADAMLETGVHLPPWEQHWRRHTELALDHHR